jgi:hypothetical protein
MIHKQALLICATVVLLLSQFSLQAQTGSIKPGSSYKTALGLGIDFGNGVTFAGPSIKHFFNAKSVGKAEVLFGDGVVMLSAYYQYHSNIPNAAGLKWTLGLGATYYDYDEAFALRPTIGLDYKIPNVPLQFELDWRPFVDISNDLYWEAARFGLGFRYCF